MVLFLYKILKNICLTGSNTSGKTSILNAIETIQDFLLFPYRKKITDEKNYTDFIKSMSPEELKNFLIKFNTLQLGEQNNLRQDEKTTIRLCHQGTIQELSLKTYIMGVLAAEMPAGFPEEALRAQAVAARTYTMYKQKLYQGDAAPEEHKGADLCDDPAHCEAYVDLEQKAEALWGESYEVYRMRIQEAVEATDGMILVYEEEPIAAVFCAAHQQRQFISACTQLKRRKKAA